MAQHVAHGFGNPLSPYDRLATVRSVLHLERWRTVERLWRCTDGRSLLLVSTGFEDRWIVVTVRLDPMAQLTQHLDHHFSLLVAFNDGFLATIFCNGDQ